MLNPHPLIMLPYPVTAVVTKPIAAFEPGRVRCDGQDWKAKLHEFSYHATLLPGQPASVIGRERITLIVIPDHCILLEQYMDEFALYIKFLELEAIQRYENRW